MSEQEYKINEPVTTKECKYCHQNFIVGHSDNLKFVLLTPTLQNHFSVSKQCYDESKKEHEKQKQDQEREKVIKSVEIKPGSGYGIVMMTELMKKVENIEFNNAQTINALRAIADSLTLIKKLLELKQEGTA